MQILQISGEIAKESYRHLPWNPPALLMQSMDGNESRHTTETSGTNNEVFLDTSLASPATSGQNRKCTKCDFQFNTKGLGRGNYKVCPSCRDMDIATNTSQTGPKQQKRTNEEVISPSTMQQSAPKKPHSLPAHEPKAYESICKQPPIRRRK